MRPELSKVDAVKQFQVPTTKSAVRTFLGLTGILQEVYLWVCRTRSPIDRSDEEERSEHSEVD